MIGGSKFEMICESNWQLPTIQYVHVHRKFGKKFDTCYVMYCRSTLLAKLFTRPYAPPHLLVPESSLVKREAIALYQTDSFWWPVLDRWTLHLFGTR